MSLMSLDIVPRLECQGYICYNRFLWKSCLNLSLLNVMFPVILHLCVAFFYLALYLSCVQDIALVQLGMPFCWRLVNTLQGLTGMYTNPQRKNIHVGLLNCFRYKVWHACRCLLATICKMSPSSLLNVIYGPHDNM